MLKINGDPAAMTVCYYEELGAILKSADEKLETV
jgi:hypothetical protein